jgi:hypothetical protein
VFRSAQREPSKSPCSASCAGSTHGAVVSPQKASLPLGVPQISRGSRVIPQKYPAAQSASAWQPWAVQ